jgi:hypothetical protein
MDHVGTILKVIGFVALLSLAGVYAADYLWIIPRVRMRSAR